MSRTTLLIVTFLALLLHNLQAQELRVTSFIEDNGDVTARTTEGRKLDANGKPCALVKVHLLEAGAKFSSMDLIEASDLRVNQYWVYMAPGAKLLDIDVPGHHTLSLRFSDLNPQILSLNGETTYQLNIDTRTDGPTTQYLEFYVTPAEALLEVDGTPWSLVRGHATRLVTFGNHTYRVTAPDHHTEEGSIAVYNADQRTSKQIALKPAYGWLDVNIGSEVEELTIYVDDKPIGHESVTHHQLSSGEHTLRVVSSLYAPYTQPFAVQDSLVTTIIPQLTADFADVTFNAPEQAIIWINDMQMGTSTWSGRLNFGTYQVETRLPDRPSKAQQITISPDGPHTFQLEAPDYYYGSLAISSEPTGAILIVDGTERGTTPMLCQRLTTGGHNIMLRLEGFKPVEDQVTVTQDNITELSYMLDELSVTSNTPVEEQQQSIPEKPVVSEPAIATAPEPAITTPTKPEPTKAKPARTAPRQLDMEYYIGASFQAGGLMGIGVQAGTYINGINVEASLTLGMNDSEPIAWKQVPQPSNAGYTYTYSAMHYGLKAGYGIDCGHNIRLTPQVGIGIVSLSGTQTAQGKGTDPDATACYALPAAIGARIDYKLMPNFAITLAPEYSFTVSETDTYSKLAEFSSHVNGFGSGFNIRIGLAYCF